MIYVVSYDMPRGVFEKPPGAFFNELESSKDWLHYMENTWLVSTDESIEDFNERLMNNIKTTDKLLIVPVESTYSGFLPGDAWQWIEEHRLE